jgi:acetyl esterase/lipase
VWRACPSRSFFCEQGFVYVAINYRLVPAVRHPDNVRDVSRCSGWVHDHIREYGGDPARLFLMGHSAGGHLVSLVATDDRRLAEYGKDPAILSGVISNDCQAYNIPAVMPQMPLAARLYPTVFGNDPGVLRDASPITHISSDKHVPPFLLIYSAASAYAPVRARHAALMASCGACSRLTGTCGRHPPTGPMNRSTNCWGLRARSRLPKSCASCAQSCDVQLTDTRLSP